METPPAAKGLHPLESFLMQASQRVVIMFTGSFDRSMATLPTAWTASVWSSTPRALHRAAISGMGKMVPVSLLAYMPNTPALVGAGQFALCLDDPALPEAAREFVAGLFAKLGRTYVLEEKFFDAFTGLAGSGPAYVLYFMDGRIISAKARSARTSGSDSRLELVSTAVDRPGKSSLAPARMAPHSVLRVGSPIPPRVTTSGRWCAWAFQLASSSSKRQAGAYGFLVRVRASVGPASQYRQSKLQMRPPSPSRPSESPRRPDATGPKTYLRWSVARSSLSRRILDRAARAWSRANDPNTKSG